MASSPLVAAIGEVHDRAGIDLDSFEGWLAARGLAWQTAARGDYPGLTLESLQMMFLCESPVRWAKAFLDDPDAEEVAPYTFFDYQQPSVLAFDQDVLHQDGAEVGKTREIIVMLFWTATTGMGGRKGNPSILVTAPQQGHLDEIIAAVETVAGANESFSGVSGFVKSLWLKPKRSPYTTMRFLCPNMRNPDKPGISRVFFRPMGHDGEALRGIHVNALGLVDEAAKAKNPVIFSEFFRALKPGCRFRIYSVPDGDRNSEYFKLSEQAVEDLPPGHPGIRKFRWAKSMMPPPFWSDERQQHFSRVYGGIDSPGYQRNVEGNHGQPAASVFPWHVLEKNLRPVPEFIGLKCVALNEQALTTETYTVETRTAESGRLSGETKTGLSRHEDSSPIFSMEQSVRQEAVRNLLRDVFAPAEPGIYWAGADLGFSKDPTEIVIFREIGAQLRRVVRISLRGFGYDAQCQFIFCLDELFGFQPNWGVDFGNAGTAVVQIMKGTDEFARGHYEERMTGFNFAESLTAIDEDGETLTVIDKLTGVEKPLRIPAKQLATERISYRLQTGGFDLPYDNEVLQIYSNHTSREGARWLIYSKENDHVIDADRAALLRKLFNEPAGVDVFCSGVYER